MKEKQPINGNKEETIQADWHLDYPSKGAELSGAQYLKQLSDLWDGWDACIRPGFPPPLADPFLLADLIDAPGAPTTKRSLIPKRVSEEQGLACPSDQPHRNRPTANKKCFEYFYLVESIKRCAAHIAFIDDTACHHDRVVAFAVINRMQLACAYRHLLQSYLKVAWDTDEGFCQTFDSEKGEWATLSPYKTLRRVLDRCDTRFKEIVCSVVLGNDLDMVINDFAAKVWIDGISQPKPVPVRAQRLVDGDGIRLKPTETEIAAASQAGQEILQIWVRRNVPTTKTVSVGQGVSQPEPPKDTRPLLKVTEDADVIHVMVNGEERELPEDCAKVLLAVYQGYLKAKSDSPKKPFKALRNGSGNLEVKCNLRDVIESTLPERAKDYPQIKNNPSNLFRNNAACPRVVETYKLLIAPRRQQTDSLLLFRTE